MSTTITIELPYPPSVNRAWRMVRIGCSCRMLQSREGRAYRMEACARLAGLVGHLARESRAFDGPLRVNITLHPPDRRKRDVDNALKALLDALQHGGVMRDDSQIVDLHVVKGDVVRGGLAVVAIAMVENPLRISTKTDLPAGQASDDDSLKKNESKDAHRK